MTDDFVPVNNTLLRLIKRIDDSGKTELSCTLQNEREPEAQKVTL